MKKIALLALTILSLIFLFSCTAEIREQKTTYLIEVDRTTITADGKDGATFRVSTSDGKSVLKDVVIYNTLSNTILEGNTFTTDREGSYTFKARVANVETQNSITIKAEKDNTASDSTVTTLEIRADRNVFTSDGKDPLEIKVYGDGVLLDPSSGYEIHYKFTEGPYYNAGSPSFTTEESGLYYFHAMLGGVKSNVLSIFAAPTSDTVEKGNLDIRSDRDIIYSRSNESVGFSVLYDGKDVTADSRIILDDWPYDNTLSSPSFSSERSGIYAFYAEYDGIRSPIIYINVKDESLSGTTTIFAEGVAKDSGWHDVNKKKDGTTGNDAVLCWAATSANMLEWYQERWIEKGLKLPEGAISGKGDEYELKIFETFQREWNHPAGSQAEYALEWYLNGKIEGPIAEGNAYPKEENLGGYFLPVWEDVRKHTGDNFVSVHEIHHQDGWSPERTRSPMLSFSRIIRNSIERGVAGIRIMAPNIHAITLWGYDMNEEGIVRAIYVTDSDNQLSRPNEPREEMLQRYELTSNGEDIYFKAYGTDCNIVAITALEGVH